MFSITPSEILTIAIVALIVVGPRRLPELARRVGNLARQLRNATEEFKKDLGTDFDDTVKPFREAAGDIAAAGKSLRETVDGELRWVDRAIENTTEAAKPKALEAPEPPPTEPGPSEDSG